MQTWSEPQSCLLLADPQQLLLSLHNDILWETLKVEQYLIVLYCK